VDHAVDTLGSQLAHTLGERCEILRALDVERDCRRHGLRQSLGDAIDEAQTIESGDQHLRTLLLRDLGHVERDRRIGDDAGDKNGLTLEQTAHEMSS
jgi:hypothetical protein